MAKRNRRRSLSSSRKGGFFGKFFFFLFLILCGGAAASAFFLFETETPTISLGKKLTYLGNHIELPIEVSDQKSGISSIEITLEQQGKISQLFNRSYERKAWFKDAGPKTMAETLAIDAKKAGFEEGEANLIIRVRDFSLNGMLSGNESVATVPVIIDTKPPRVAITHSQQYIRPGGSGIVIYSLTEPAKRHGVQVDDQFFQGYPLTAGSSQFISYIALPWDSQAPQLTIVKAIDEAGNEGKASFSPRFKPVNEKTDKINVSQGFLNKKIPEFEENNPGLSGSMLEKFLYTNNTLRKENAKTIKELCAEPVMERLWTGKFGRMAGARKAGFAEQRTYFHNDTPIDHQTHLGIDLASTAAADVRAANRGKVVFADYLGIYGNMIIIDHGQGVFSLYSHLSKIDTTVGALVEAEEHIGNTGASGMAGGDHLHFSMLVHGIFVNPVEWWDQHWIDVNIEAFIGTTGK